MSKKGSRKQPPQQRKIPIQVTIAVIAFVGVIATGVFTYLGFRAQAELPIKATQTAEARLTTIALSATQAAPPTAPSADTQQPLETLTPESLAEYVGYDFESDTHGWTTSEGDFKLARLSTTALIAFNGSQSLVLDTELYGSGSKEYADHNGEDIYRHTEAVVYFNQTPNGMDTPGPYDLTGKRLSCFVYLPIGLAAPDDAPQAYVRLTLKDKNFANRFSEPVMIGTDITEQWLELIYVLNPDPNSDFDTTQVNAMGVRLDSLDGSTVSYKGPIYVDYCTIDF